MSEGKELHSLELTAHPPASQDPGHVKQLAQLGEKWREILNKSSVIVYKPDQHVFYAGHYPSGVFVVLSGKLALVRQDTRVRKIVREVPPFWAIGFDLLNSGETYPYDGVATGHLKMCFITKNSLQQIMVAG